MGHKVVYNACYGGFGLSEKAKARYVELTGCAADIYHRDIERHDPALVRVVEELGAEASDRYACLQIEEIDSLMYRIDEYDGFEAVETPVSVDWVQIK